MTVIWPCQGAAAASCAVAVWLWQQQRVLWQGLAMEEAWKYKKDSLNYMAKHGAGIFSSLWQNNRIGIFSLLCCKAAPWIINSFALQKNHSFHLLWKNKQTKKHQERTRSNLFSVLIPAYLKKAAVSPPGKASRKSVAPSATSGIKCPAARRAK